MDVGVDDFSGVPVGELVNVVNGTENSTAFCLLAPASLVIVAAASLLIAFAFSAPLQIVLTLSFSGAAGASAAASIHCTKVVNPK